MENGFSFTRRLNSIPLFLILSCGVFPQFAFAWIVPQFDLGSSFQGYRYKSTSNQEAVLTSSSSYELSPGFTWIPEGKSHLALEVTSMFQKVTFNSPDFGNLSRSNATMYHLGCLVDYRFSGYTLKLGIENGQQLLYSSTGQVDLVSQGELDAGISKILITNTESLLKVSAVGSYDLPNSSIKSGYGGLFSTSLEFRGPVQFGFFGAYGFQNFSTSLGTQSSSEIRFGITLSYLGMYETRGYLEDVGI